MIPDITAAAGIPPMGYRIVNSYSHGPFPAAIAALLLYERTLHRSEVIGITHPG
jgi:hypothetical protein